MLGLAVGLLVASLDSAEARRRKRGGGYAPPYADFVIDVQSGRVLHQTSADALRHPASVTKVMTLYLLFEELERGRYRLDSELAVSANASRQAPSKLGVPAGESITVEDAIKALVTKSANDIAVAVAENIAGSEEAFAQRMTKRARALGMTRTTFVNASGLPDTEQVTTARDLARLGIAVHDRFPKYYRYFALRGFDFEGRYFRNHNRLLGNIEAVDGIKTGYTRMSGFNLLTSARADGRHIVAVVLGGRSGRSRDAVMAGLVHTYLHRAVAGRRTAPVLASADIDVPEEAPARRRAMPPTAPLPPTPPGPEIRPPALTATGVVLGQMATPVPPARPAGPPVDLKSIRPVVATARATPPTPASPPALRTADVPPAPIPGPGGKAANRLVAPPEPAAAPLAFTGPVGVKPPRPPLDLKPTGSVKKPGDVEEDEEEEETPARRAPEKRIAAPATPPKAEEPPAAPTTPAGWVIQLAAPDDKAKALEILDRAKTRVGKPLAAARPFAEPVQKGGSTLWRARFAGFDSDTAKAACREVMRSGFACFATRG